MNKNGPLAIALMLGPGLAYLRGAGELGDEYLKSARGEKVVVSGRTTFFSG